MAGGIGQVGRRRAVGDPRRRVGAGGQEQLDQLVVAVLGGRVDRGVAVALGRVHIGPGREQDPADLAMAARRPRCAAAGRASRSPRRRSTSAPASRRRRAASALPKNAARWRAVKPSGETRAARAGSVARSSRQAVGVAERGGLEDVEVRVGGEQRVGRRPVRAIPRQQDRRDARRVAGIRAGPDRDLQERADAGGVAGLDGVDAGRRSRVGRSSTSLGAATNIRPWHAKR